MDITETTFGSSDYDPKLATEPEPPPPPGLASRRWDVLTGGVLTFTNPPERDGYDNVVHQYPMFQRWTKWVLR